MLTTNYLYERQHLPLSCSTTSRNEVIGTEAKLAVLKALGIRYIHASLFVRPIRIFINGTALLLLLGNECR
jgi:hypothetical protein